MNFSISLTRLPHGKPVANAAAAARLLVDAYAEAYAPLLPSPFSFAESGDPGGSSFGPRSLVFMLGYRLTADDEGERGSSGVEHPGTSASLLISTPGSFSPSHCLSLRLSMVSRGTRRGGRYVRRGRRQIQRIGAVSCRDREKCAKVRGLIRGPSNGDESRVARVRWARRGMGKGGESDRSDAHDERGNARGEVSPSSEIRAPTIRFPARVSDGDVTPHAGVCNSSAAICD